MFVRLALASEEDEYEEMARMAVEESARHVGYDEECVRRTFWNYLEQAHPTIFVVEHRRKLIGFLNATISSYSFCSGIFTTQEVLYVRPENRGTRAAALLLRELVRWSDQLGALETTGGNDNALFSETTAKLLGKFGFEQVGYFMRRIGTAAHG